MVKKTKNVILAGLISLAAIVAAPFAVATISGTSSKTISSLGNNATTNYTISFSFQDNDQIEVYLRDESTTPYTETQLVYGVGADKYTITGGDPGTTVVMGTAPTTTERVVIRRAVPKRQTVAYDETAAFPAADHEEQMDRNVMMIQELQEQVDRAPKFSKLSSTSEITIPEPEAGTFLGWNSDGTDLENKSSLLDTLDAELSGTTTFPGSTEIDSSGNLSVPNRTSLGTTSTNSGAVTVLTVQGATSPSNNSAGLQIFAGSSVNNYGLIVKDAAQSNNHLVVFGNGKVTTKANTLDDGSGAAIIAGTLNVTGTITGTLSGNASTATSATSATSATNATNSAITDDTTTNATMYPVWVTTTSGNLPLKVASTKLGFNPSTGTLATTTFSGSLSGTTAALSGTVTGNRLGVADGTTASPSIYSTTTTNTGIYFKPQAGTSDAVALVSGGVDGLYVDANSGASGRYVRSAFARHYFEDGSNSAPALTFWNQGSLGLYRSASNEMSVAVNSTQMVKFTTTGIESSGTLGVGTAPVSGQGVTLSTAGTNTALYGQYITMTPTYSSGSAFGATASNINFTGSVSSSNASVLQGTSVGFNTLISTGVTDSGSWRGGLINGARLGGASDLGTLTNIYGLDIGFGNSSTGGSATTSNAYGIKLTPLWATGTVSNSYALYIESATTGGTGPASNYYAVYQADANAKNLFTGTVTANAATTLGTTSTNSGSYPLTVRGNSGTGTSIGPLIRAGTNSSDYALTVVNSGNTSNLFVIRGDGYTFTKNNILDDNAGNLTITGTLLQMAARGAASTPTCAGGNTGTLALTSGYKLCVCNGSAWKNASDGSTGCTF